MHELQRKCSLRLKIACHLDWFPLLAITLFMGFYCTSNQGSCLFPLAHSCFPCSLTHLTPFPCRANWFKITKNREISSGSLAYPFTCLLALLTGIVNHLMSQHQAILNQSAVISSSSTMVQNNQGSRCKYCTGPLARPGSWESE